MKTPETGEADEAEETPVKAPAKEGNHVCGHCMRVFSTQMKKAKHTMESHQEATAWVPTDH
jgi:hypothetical protein